MTNVPNRAPAVPVARQPSDHRTGLGEVIEAQCHYDRRDRAENDGRSQKGQRGERHDLYRVRPRRAGPNRVTMSGASTSALRRR